MPIDPTLPAAVSPDGTPRKLGALFSGVGGFELAWVRAGGEVAWMCEIDAKAREVLRERFPGVPIYEDVRELDPSEVEAVDVLTGGSPCQSFSTAGMRKGMHGESGLLIEMLRIIDGLEARGLQTVVWENVPGVLTIRNPDGGHVWPQIVASFLYGLNPESVAAARAADTPAPERLRTPDGHGGYRLADLAVIDPNNAPPLFVVMDDLSPEDATDGDVLFNPTTPPTFTGDKALETLAKRVAKKAAKDADYDSVPVATQVLLATDLFDADSIAQALLGDEQSDDLDAGVLEAIEDAATHDAVVEALVANRPDPEAVRVLRPISYEEASPRILLNASDEDIAAVVDEFSPKVRWNAGMASSASRGLAWRVLDSRYVAEQVPQRRRRMFAIVHCNGTHREERAFATALALDENAEFGERDSDGVWTPPWMEQLDLFSALMDIDDGDDAPAKVWLLMDSKQCPESTQWADLSEGRCIDGDAECSHTSLSDVLEPVVGRRYMLSPRARLGIVLRANRRGKTLPDELETALSFDLPFILGEDLWVEAQAVRGAIEPELKARIDDKLDAYMAAQEAADASLDAAAHDGAQMTARVQMPAEHAVTLGAPKTGGQRQDLDSMSYVPMADVSVAAKAGAGKVVADESGMTLFRAVSHGEYVPEEAEGGATATLHARDGNGGTVDVVAFAGQATTINGAPHTHTLKAEGCDGSEDGTGRGTPLVGGVFRKSRRPANNADPETWVDGQHSNTLNTFDEGSDTRTTHAVLGVVADDPTTIKSVGPDDLDGGQVWGAPLCPDCGQPQVTHAFPVGDNIADSFPGDQIDGSVGCACDTAPTPDAPAVLLTMREGKPGGGKGPLLSEEQSLTLATGNNQVLFDPNSTPDKRDPQAYTLHAFHSTAMKSPTQGRAGFPTEAARTLDTTGGFATSQGGTVVAGDTAEQQRELAIPIDSSQAQRSSGATGVGTPGTGIGEDGDPSPALGSSRATPSVGTTYGVRRLTPLECERLQGFPPVLRFRLDRMGRRETAQAMLMAGVVTVENGQVAQVLNAFGGPLHQPVQLGTDGSAELLIGDEKVVIDAADIIAVADGRADELPSGGVDAEAGDTPWSMPAPPHEWRAAPLRYVRERLDAVGASTTADAPWVEGRGWTQPSADAEHMADTQRYRQLGNAVSVPVVGWLLSRAGRSLTRFAAV